MCIRDSSKPIPVVSGKSTKLEAVKVVEFDLELDMSPVEQFDQQDFVERLAAKLNIPASLISVKVTPIGERRRLTAEQRRPNGTSTLSGLKLEVTIQVPQELKTGLGDRSSGSTLLAERAERLRSLVNSTDLMAALGVEFRVSRSAEVVTVRRATEVDCAPGYCAV